MASFFIKSFGCRVNYAESLIIKRQMIKSYFSYNSNDPDIVIINSCAVTNNAERSIRQFINQVLHNNTNANIYVTGCAATYWLKKNITISNVKLISNQDKKNIVKLIKMDYKSPKPIKLLKYKISDQIEKSNRLTIKIQDGCHKFCTYCIVPYLRGLPKSISKQTIIKNINNYTYKLSEVILTAINTAAYGYKQNTDFVDLLNYIVTHTNIPRISCGSIHPWSINNKFLQFYKKKQFQQKFVHFFHIPIQSGNQEILKLMKRDYQLQDINKILLKIIKIKPEAFLATDIIVGFLDENEDQFNITYNWIKKSPFSRFHVFRYSPRIGTIAEKIKHRYFCPSEKDKITRSKILRELSDYKYSQFRISLINYSSNSLLLNKQYDKYNFCLLDNQVPALVNKLKYQPGDLVSVLIYDFDNKKKQLIGKIV